jgi:hypothetical protein
MEKATNAEIELRLALVYEMVIKGASRKYILRYCAENYQINSRQVDEYLKRVNEEIKETFSEKEKKDLIAKQLAQLEDLYVKNYTIEDFRECRNVLESKAKILGLNSATEINVKGEPRIFKLD